MTAPNEPSPTIGAMLAGIVRKYAPGLVYAGLHTFRVDSVSGGRVSFAPSGSRVFGPQRAAYQWPGVAGAEAIPKVGSEVVLAFLDSDPDRPAIVAFQPLRVDGGIPDEVKIDATSTIDLGASANKVHVETDLDVDGDETVAGDTKIAGTLRVGGMAATPVALSSEINIWAALVTTALGQLVGYVNGIVPGTVTPAVIPSLVDPSASNTSSV